MDDYSANILPEWKDLLTRVAADAKAVDALKLEKERTRQLEAQCKEVEANEVTKRLEAMEKTKQVQIACHERLRERAQQEETKRAEAVERTQQAIQRTRQLELHLQLAQQTESDETYRRDEDPTPNPDTPSEPVERLMVKFTIPDPYAHHVAQFEVNGTYVRSWASAGEAAEELGISYAHIRDCVNNNLRQSGGFAWRHEDSLLEREVPYLKDGRYQQVRPDGSFVTSYTSKVEVARSLCMDYYRLKDAVDRDQGVRHPSRSPPEPARAEKTDSARAESHQSTGG